MHHKKEEGDREKQLKRLLESLIVPRRWSWWYHGDIKGRGPAAVSIAHIKGAGWLASFLDLRSIALTTIIGGREACLRKSE